MLWKRQVALELLKTPQIETVYDPKTRTTRIKMTDLTTGKVIYEELHTHPMPNKNQNLGTATSNEAGSIVRVYGVDVMTTPAVEQVYDPRKNTTTLSFSNPLGGKPFWVKKLEAVEVK